MTRGIILLIFLTITAGAVIAEETDNFMPEQTESYKCDLMMRGYEFTNDGLSEAIIKQDTEAVELFVKADININLSDNEGFTALDRAMEINNEQTVALLCHAGGETKFNRQKTFENKKEKETNFTVNSTQKDSNVSQSNEESTSMNEFCKAVDESNYEFVKKNIKRTDDKDVLTEDGLAPVHYAIFNNDIEMIQILIDSGAEINNRTSDGLTALDITILNGQKEIAKLLLQNGAALSGQVAQELKKFGCHIQYDEIFDLYDASFEDIFETMDKIQKQIDSNGKI